MILYRIKDRIRSVQHPSESYWIKTLLITFLLCVKTRVLLPFGHTDFAFCHSCSGFNMYDGNFNLNNFNYQSEDTGWSIQLEVFLPFLKYSTFGNSWPVANSSPSQPFEIIDFSNRSCHHRRLDLAAGQTAVTT